MLLQAEHSRISPICIARTDIYNYRRQSPFLYKCKARNPVVLSVILRDEDANTCRSRATE